MNLKYQLRNVSFTQLAGCKSGQFLWVLTHVEQFPLFSLKDSIGFHDILPKHTVSGVLGKEYNMVWVAEPLAAIGLNLVVPTANPKARIGLSTNSSHDRAQGQVRARPFIALKS